MTTSLTVPGCDRASYSPAVNWHAGPGVPGLIPALEQGAAGALIVAANARSQQLTFEVPSGERWLMVGFALTLWAVSGSAGSRTIAKIPSDDTDATGAAAGDMRLRLHRVGNAVTMNDIDLLWSTIACDGDRPFVVPDPWLLGANEQFAISLRSLTGSALAISATAYVLRRSASDRLPGHVREAVERMRQAALAGRGPDPITGDTGPADSALALEGRNGRCRIIALPNQPIALSGSGNFEAPGTDQVLTLASDDEGAFNVEKITARAVANGGSKGDRFLHPPVMVNVKNDIGGHWLTNNFVPLHHLSGWGGEPHHLKLAPWAWGRRGRQIVTLRPATDTAYDVYFDCHGSVSAAQEESVALI